MKLFSMQFHLTGCDSRSILCITCISHIAVYSDEYMLYQLLIRNTCPAPAKMPANAMVWNKPGIPGAFFTESGSVASASSIKSITLIFSSSEKLCSITIITGSWQCPHGERRLWLFIDPCGYLVFYWLLCSWCGWCWCFWHDDGRDEKWPKVNVSQGDIWYNTRHLYRLKCDVLWPGC